MFVLLEWRLGQIEGIFDKSSSLLFNAFEKFSEGFKNGHLAYNYFPNSMDYCEAPRRQYEAIIEDQLCLQGEEQTRQRLIK